MSEIENVGDALFPAPSVHPSGGISMTKQSDADLADITKIVNRHLVAGVPIFPDGRALYGDFTQIEDYHESLNRVLSAQDDFMRLPVAVRDACSNDVGVLLQKLETEEGISELKALGLDDSGVPKDEPITPVTDEPPAPGDDV